MIKRGKNLEISFWDFHGSFSSSRTFSVESQKLLQFSIWLSIIQTEYVLLFGTFQNKKRKRKGDFQFFYVHSNQLVKKIINLYIVSNPFPFFSLQLDRPSANSWYQIYQTKMKDHDWLTSTWFTRHTLWLSAK